MAPSTGQAVDTNPFFRPCPRGLFKWHRHRTLNSRKRHMTSTSRESTKPISKFPLTDVPDSFAEEYEDHLKTLRPLSTKINNYRDALVSLTNIADESCQTLGVIEGKMFAVFPNRNAQRRAPSRASAKSSKPGQRLDCARIRLMSTAPTVAMLSTAPWTNSSPTLPSCSNVVSKLFGN